MPIRTDKIRQVERHFRSADPVIARLIDEVGPFRLKLERNRFRMLVHSIISQQISTTAATAIRLRLEQLVAPANLVPDSIARLGHEQLRSAGLSGRKAEFVADLAQRTGAGTLRLDRIGRLDDEQVIAELVQVRGIGRWTAQMFLIFALGRLDVFPHDDFGVRSALRSLYGLKKLPGKAECLEIGERWRPFATIGSWYCWRSLEKRQ